jgi:uncharacterized protein (TIGR02145 family)
LLIQRRVNYIIILFAALSALVSCDESAHLGDIEGVTFFAGTIIPITGVSVDVEGVTTQSSEDGSYRLEGIPTGNHTIKALKPGFIPFTSQITVIEGAITILIPMFSPDLTSEVQGVISGDFSGSTQPGLVVILLNPDGSESNITGTTDEEGYYQLQNIPFGDRTLIVKSANVIVFKCSISLSTSNYQLDITIPEPMVFTDERDGKNYTAGKIGDQIWLLENLAYLPEVFPPDRDSDSLELYYVYGYQGTDLNQAKESNNYMTYGVLYNWAAAMSACPEGWHLPDDDEWQILEIYLGMEPENADQVKWRLTGAVGNKLKNLSGWDSNGNGDNSSGFSALPGGSRGNNEQFSGIGSYGNFWTASLNTISLPWNRFLSFDNSGVSRYGLSRSLGFSVRCLKDD